MRAKGILLLAVCMVLASISLGYAESKRSVQENKKYKKWTSLVFTQGGERTFRVMAEEMNGPSLLAIDFTLGCNTILPAIIAPKSPYPANMSELEGSVQAGRKKPEYTSYSVEYLSELIAFVAFTGMDYTDFLNYVGKSKKIVFTIELPEFGKAGYAYPLDGLAEAAENTFKLCREYTAESKKKNAGEGKRTPR